MTERWLAENPHDEPFGLFFGTKEKNTNIGAVQTQAKEKTDAASTVKKERGSGSVAYSQAVVDHV